VLNCSGQSSCFYQKKKVLIPLISWYLGSNFFILSHYLAYFNELIGGLAQESKYLIDANLSWGQDDKLFFQYQKQHPALKVNPSPFHPQTGLIVVNVNAFRGLRQNQPVYS
jgi:hypothetical protein